MEIFASFFPDYSRLTGCRKMCRHPGVCRGPEDVDFIDPIALDPGLVVTPEGWYPGRGDGFIEIFAFIDTMLKAPK
jgi:hypothetical protein